jgi:hypothetical protein
MQNPMHSRGPRTIILFLAGLAIAWITSRILVPWWPHFCDDTVAELACTPERYATAFGYTTIVFGVLTMLFGPIAGSFIDLLRNGANWETPRGTETVITNMPLLVGALYMAIGLARVMTA